MARHITEKDFRADIGLLSNIEFLNESEITNLVDIINKLARRIATLEGNNPELYIYSKTGVLPEEGNVTVA